MVGGSIGDSLSVAALALIVLQDSSELFAEDGKRSSTFIVQRKEILMTHEIAAANKELVRRFYKEVYGNWNMALADDLIAPQFTSHDWPEDGPTGPKAFRDYYSAIRSALPDARYEVDDLIAEGDRVVVRWRLLGTHKGAFRGIAPTGQPITLKGIAIYRTEHGKLMERWVVSDLYGALAESGALSAR
jgi:predicted ester cyclase